MGNGPCLITAIAVGELPNTAERREEAIFPICRRGSECENLNGPTLILYLGRNMILFLLSMAFSFVLQMQVGLTSYLCSAAPHQKASRSYSFKLCQVKSEDSEGTMSGESIILDEQQTLERELQIAIQEENYAQAAKIRDSLRVLQEDGKASVLAANARFYNSFKNGDLASMQALWAKEDNVCVVHPGVSGISGYDLVMGSWEFVWADYEFPLQIEIKDVQVHVRGDLGYVTCIELVKTKGSSWGRQFATNVFERINGQWFICIHHASHVDL
ncbi:hypothetical protein TEA_016446 [Camellia sinensis var. sinensis]|uniref:UVR domain-containing protein n=1 Tax=Camellia sinensis var. sinensis TaxID=542762 RepID=A0A4S4CXA3_CAMSN|nr:hypothetical protein TEA_016446 [Camellia sinensis var. sinensis]